MSMNEKVKDAYKTPSQPTDDQYVAEVAKNYKNYFNTTLQNAALNQYAQKNMQAANRANGLMGAGYASTANAQLANATMNANQNALNAYSDANMQAQESARQRWAADQQDIANNMSGLSLQNADKYLESRGYSKRDDGKWYDANGTMASNFVNDMYFNMSNEANNGGQMDLDSIGNLRYTINYDNGRTSNRTIADKFSKEFGVLKDMEAKGQLEAGTIIKLNAVDGKDRSAYISYNDNGTWSYVDKDAYDNAEKKKTIHGNKVK